MSRLPEEIKTEATKVPEIRPETCAAQMTIVPATRTGGNWLKVL